MKENFCCQVSLVFEPLNLVRSRSPCWKLFVCNRGWIQRVTCDYIRSCFELCINLSATLHVHQKLHKNLHQLQNCLDFFSNNLNLMERERVKEKRRSKTVLSTKDEIKTKLAMSEREASQNLCHRTNNEKERNLCIKESNGSVTHLERNKFLKRQDVPRSRKRIQK